MRFADADTFHLDVDGQSATYRRADTPPTWLLPTIGNYVTSDSLGVFYADVNVAANTRADAFDLQFTGADHLPNSWEFTCASAAICVLQTSPDYAQIKVLTDKTFQLLLGGKIASYSWRN